LVRPDSFLPLARVAGIPPAKTGRIPAPSLPWNPFPDGLRRDRSLREDIAMNCHELARRIERLQPEADVRNVARLCLLLANATPDVGELENDEQLAAAWQEIYLRMQATADQHAAMTEELDGLARSDPKRFTADQIWVLIRAIKVQSQILQMYLGEPALSV
jgi:hypothetical protein